MFEEEREMWEKFFGYFKKKFNEDVGILPGAFEDEDIEIDMIIGEQTKKVRGIRVFQLTDEEFDDDDEDLDEEEDSDECLEKDGGEEKTDEKDDSSDDKADEEDLDDEDDDEDFEDGEDQGILVYDLIYSPTAKPSGLVAAELDFPEPEQVEDEDSIEEDSYCKACEEGKGEHNHPVVDETVPDDKVWITMEIYTENGQLDSEIKCAVVTYKESNEKQVFVETDDFPDL